MGEQLKRYLKRHYQRNNHVMSEMNAINANRFFIIGLIGAPVNVVHMIMFWMFDPANSIEATWRQGIFLTHGFVFVLMLSLIVSGLYFRKHPDMNYSFFPVVQYLLIGIIFIMGIVITGIDQLVVTNITPFVIASLIVALAFYTRPLVTVIYFVFFYVFFSLTLIYMINDETLILSNLVNGLTTVSVGLLFSFIMWDSKAKNIEMNRMLLMQQTQLQKSNKQLDYLAYHDILTGLYNRSAFKRVIEKCIKEGSIEGCLVMIDLDRFKTINDTYGHPAGDEVLKVFSEMLKGLTVDKDVLCRWGGEEFLIYLKDASLEDAYKIVETIRLTIESKSFKVNGETITLTASLGVSIFNPNDEDIFNSAYERIDTALYRAKHTGRNRIEVEE